VEKGRNNAYLNQVDNWLKTKELALDWYGDIRDYVIGLKTTLVDLALTNLAKLKDLRDNLYIHLWDYVQNRKDRLAYLVGTAYANLQDLVGESLSRLKYLRDTAYVTVVDFIDNLVGALRTYVQYYAERARVVLWEAYSHVYNLAVTLYEQARQIISDWYSKIADFAQGLYTHVVQLARDAFDKIWEMTVTWRDKVKDFVDNFARWGSIAHDWYTRIAAVFTGDFWAKLFGLLQDPAGAIWAWLWVTAEKQVEQWLLEHW